MGPGFCERLRNDLLNQKKNQVGRFTSKRASGPAERATSAHAHAHASQAPAQPEPFARRRRARMRELTRQFMRSARRAASTLGY